MGQRIVAAARGRRARWIPVVLAALGLVVAAISVGSASASATACKAGTKKVRGGTARIVCGAKATVKANGRTYVVENGECDLYPKYVVVSIGIVAKGTSYFGLFVGKSPVAKAGDPVAAKDGTYDQGLILLATPHFLGFLHNETALKIVLKNGRRAGTFSATNPADARLKTRAVRMSGSFRC
jgi:hypothetical protein